MTTESISEKAQGSSLIRELGTLDATMIVVGSMIGSGIFITSAESARLVGTPGWLLAAWAVAGLMTVCGAATAAEIAAMMPRAGGQYCFLRDVYSPIFGFLFGWAMFLVVQTGTIAAVSVAFAKFLGVFQPGIAADVYLLSPLRLGNYAISLSSQQLVAVVLIVGLTAVNMFGLKFGKWIQNSFTFTKTAALFGLIVVGILLGTNRESAAWTSSWWDASANGWSAETALEGLGLTGGAALLLLFGKAMIGPLFSQSAWNNVTFTGAEIKQPERVLPRAMILGTASVVILYFLANVAYVVTLKFTEIEHAPNERVGTAVMQAIFGPRGAQVMAAAILISTFGCVNGLVMAGARIYFAMARDGLFFKSIARTNRFHVPGWALAAQGLWAVLLVLPVTAKQKPGTEVFEYGNLYNDLLEYIIPVDVTFYTLMVAAVILLRFKLPDAPRPYRTFAYPLPPLIYIGLAVLLVCDFIFLNPGTSGIGFLIVLAGIPVYLIWSRFGAPTEQTRRAGLEYSVMIVSWNWLTDYLRLDMSVEALTERLALSGLNLESVSEVGGDLAIDLEVTSNRPDCLGHLGVAREIAVLFDKERRTPDPRPPVSGTPVEKCTSVTIQDDALCPRFTARVISGAKTGESPWWLRKRLETIGVRPISNIVDVTNYVMFECGQPLHAYDLDRLAEKRLVVRRAKSGETLTAINNRVYELSPEMLVIADAARPVGLGGVMGGADTEIGPQTTHVLLEAAGFDPISVRRTSRALGLFSPSSFRFERPIDPEITEWASRRASELILKVAGGTLHPGVIDLGKPPAEKPPISLRLGQIARVLGIEIDRAQVVRILTALGLKDTSQGDGSLCFRPPSWRSDLEREIDLIEEVARIHGYHHIPEDRPVAVSSAPRGPRERVESAVRQVLSGAGFDEAVTVSLVEDRLAVAVAPGSPLSPLRVDHSSRKRESALRQSLIPSLLSARLHNETHGQTDADLFEIANVYMARTGSPLPLEPTHLALVSGADFRCMKGVVESLLESLHISDALQARPVDISLFAAGSSAELSLGGVHLGFLGEIDPAALAQFELRNRCVAAEIDFDVLLKRANLVSQLRPLPPYPAVVRDLSLEVARNLQWGELYNAVTSAAGRALESVSYLDTFRGGNLADGMQSVHFSMVFRHPERTLTGEEVDRAVKSVVEAAERRFSAKLRT